MRVLVRFAPSPTGLLHVGNASIALANSLFARHNGGQFLLRLDDTDRERSRPEYAAAIEQDLRWLRIEWDEFLRQSDRMELYEAAAERLKVAGRLYPCFESEEELKVKRERQIKRHRPPVYDRAMLKLTPEQRAAAETGGKKPYWRFLLSDREVEWNDLVRGPRRVKLPAISDPVVLRSDGTPLYTFTSVVDDVETGVTHVIRGEDHVTNTAVQIDIAEALGAKPGQIAFGHLSLLVGAEGEKLSKRIDSLTLRGLRNDGVEATTLAAYLARLGTSDDPTVLSMAELAAQYDIRRASHSPPRFDPRQLLALNRRVLQGLPFAAVADRLPAGATERFWLAIRGNIELLSEARGWWDVVAGTIVPPVIEGAGNLLRDALETLPPEPWDDSVWATWTRSLRERTGRSGRALFMPLRLALTGEEHGPEMRDLLPLMGRARVVHRLQTAGG
jgi:glutamyl-tRNA synthetase